MHKLAVLRLKVIVRTKKKKKKTLVILIRQTLFVYHICIVEWLWWYVYSNKIKQRLLKLWSKNLKCWRNHEQIDGINMIKDMLKIEYPSKTLS